MLPARPAAFRVATPRPGRGGAQSASLRPAGRYAVPLRRVQAMGRTCCLPCVCRCCAAQIALLMEAACALGVHDRSCGGPASWLSVSRSRGHRQFRRHRGSGCSPGLAGRAFPGDGRADGGGTAAHAPMRLSGWPAGAPRLVAPPAPRRVAARGLSSWPRCDSRSRAW